MTKDFRTSVNEAVKASRVSGKKDKPVITMSVAKFLHCVYRQGFVSGKNTMLDKGVWVKDGWKYNFRPYLKKFIMKQTGLWDELFAPSKAYLYRAIAGHIEAALEVGA
ncbi:MAG: hypothetical protein HPY53_01055 [Brevinematales bacterium]|nr:hypothetical protein [Brevinematales bacterium]